jgi:multidrug efflux pump subunit AcrA (membrane-fusion protein)
VAAYFARHRKAGSPGANGSGDDQIPGRVATTRVVVTEPRRGGLARTVRQPDTVLAFDKAALYAKVSGYLVRQKVDIGDIVKKNVVLAEVDAPEFFRSRDQF